MATTTKTLHERLVEIQQHLNVPKNQRNSFGNYNYRSCEDIVEAVKPLLAPDCTLLIHDEIVFIGNHYYIKATATISKENERIFTTGYARESEEKKGMDASQITGSTSSYARKYALNGLFAIDDTRDADTQDNRPAKKETPDYSTKRAEGVTYEPDTAPLPKQQTITNEEDYSSWSKAKLMTEVSSLMGKGKIKKNFVGLNTKTNEELIELLKGVKNE